MADTAEGTEPTESEENDLRLALRMIGEEAGRPDAPPRPATRPARWRRRGTVGGVLVTAAALSVGALLFWLADGRSVQSSGDADGRGLTDLEGIACARLIADGEVVAVRDASQPHQVVVTFAVRDWIKPAQGAKEIEINTVDPEWLEEKPFKTGQRLLILDSGRPNGEVLYYQGRHAKWQRDLFKRDLPKAAKTKCPAFWRDQDDDGAVPPDA
ncbi:hypothetical protein ACFV2X_32435 [Streptomyces sp. NPDC059679]|uniref:hypothetical protein n=1 Tax=Streptomyces sp. NPDC059679 TaxID=3346903 RepID=UPI003692FEE1